MSAPKLKVKFRLKNGLPFSIENLSGTLFRCGSCGKIFYSRTELDNHLLTETPPQEEEYKFPEVNRNVTVSLIYTTDLRDLTNSEFPILHRGDKLLKIKKPLKNK